MPARSIRAARRRRPRPAASAAAGSPGAASPTAGRCPTSATRCRPIPIRPASRGLLFLCFQANIEKQFEFIQRTWVDNPNFPDNVFNLPFKDDTGDDPLIGQDLNEKQRWPEKWGNSGAGREKFNFEAAVTLKGGEYFFAPSKPFLAGL